MENHGSFLKSNTAYDNPRTENAPNISSVDGCQHKTLKTCLMIMVTNTSEYEFTYTTCMWPKIWESLTFNKHEAKVVVMSWSSQI